MKQKLLRSMLMLSLFVTGTVASWADVPASQSEDNGKVMYLQGPQKTGFNIHIYHNDQWMQTTYKDLGYHTVISFDGRTRTGIGFTDPRYGFNGETGNFEFGKTYTINGIEVTLVASIPDANTGSVTVRYLMTNVSTEKKSFRIGSYADTQVGANDKCNVYQEGDAVVMEDDLATSPSYAGIYKIIGVTPFDTMWLGHWSQSGMPTKVFTNAFEYSRGTDSAIAWSWNITLEPGESTVRQIGTGQTVEIFERTHEIDLDVPENLGRNASGVVDGSVTDLYDFLEFYLQKSTSPTYVTLRLKSNARYIITKPLQVTCAIAIEGVDGKYPAIIDASRLDGPFIQISDGKPAYGMNIKDYYITMYDVTMKNLVIKGLKHELFSGNGQPFLIPYLNVDNCNVHMEGASGKSVFNLSGSTFVETMTLTNSTFSADDATTWKNGGFIDATGVTKEQCAAYRQRLIMTSNTLFNISKGYQSAMLSENSKKFQTYTINKNIFINSGKQGEFIKGLNSGVDSPVPSWQVSQNSFLWTTDNTKLVDICAQEGASSMAVAKGSCIKCTDNLGFDSSGNAILGITVAKMFSNGKEGMQLGDFSLNPCPQKTALIGDPRWFSPSKLEKYITYSSLDSSKDLARAINNYIKDGFSQFVLEDNIRYEVKQPIVTDRSILIKGKNVHIHTLHDGPFIELSTTPGVELVNNYYRTDEITLKGLYVYELKSNIIYDNNTPYCVTALTIDDCVFQLQTEQARNDALIAFQAGGVKDFTIKNSTVYGNGAGAKYFLRLNNSARLDRYGFDAEKEYMNFNYVNNTFYNLLTADGQWANGNGVQGYARAAYDIEKNIWYNCGKDIVRRLAFGRFNANSPVTIDRNTYFNDDVDISAAEANYDQSGTALTSHPGFKRPANGDFTLYGPSQQTQERTGDPRWFVSPHYIANGIETVKSEKAADEGAWYTIQGVRVDRPAKGIYIHNGRKVVVR